MKQSNLEMPVGKSQFSLYFIPLCIKILITLSQTFPHEIPSPVSWSFLSEFSAILTPMKSKGVLQSFLIELWCLSLKTLTTFLNHHFRSCLLFSEWHMNNTLLSQLLLCAASCYRLLTHSYSLFLNGGDSFVPLSSCWLWEEVS